MCFYRTKLGTIPYANVESPRPLLAGDRIWIPETADFRPVRARFRRDRRTANRMVPCVVDRVDGDVLFLTRM